MRTPKRLSPLLVASGLVALSSSAALAQEYHNTTEQINGNWASGAPTVTFGPNADITINGDWYLTANTVTVNPAAKIGGTGTLHIMTPATYGAAATATTLNAGGTMGSGTGIGCKVSLENGSTVVLAGTGDLVLNNNLAFAKTGAHLVLGSNNATFTSAALAVPTTTVPATGSFSNQPANATAFSNAYAVTNGTGTVGKQALATNAAFLFPVGATAATDYTPATVTNTAAARNLSARVQSYTASTPVEGNVTRGVNRTWQIAGSTAGTASVALQHNAATEGSAFDRNKAFVTQYGANGWSVGAPMAATTPNYTHTGSFTVPTTGDATYFSKSSDTVNSITPFIAVSPIVLLQGAYSGSAMTNLLRTNGLIPASQPYGIAPFNYAGTENAAATPSTTTDWVLVELRSATDPNTVVATRAGLLKNDGTITDIDGTTSLSFRNTAPGSYFVAVRHRNHLGVRSAAALTFTQDATTSYDFTTAQTQAYQNSSISTNNAQVALDGGRFGMWGGNANSNATVNYGAIASDRFFLLTSPRNAGISSGLENDASTPVVNTYSNSDLTLNGTVNYGAISSDRFFLLVNVLGNDRAKVINQHL